MNQGYESIFTQKCLSILQQPSFKMQRRTALKTVALSIGSVITLPAWANAWSINTLQNQHFNLSFSKENLLAEIVETMIPKTDTPGAKDLEIIVSTISANKVSLEKERLKC